jgi:hypothetical protein
MVIIWNLFDTQRFVWVVNSQNGEGTKEQCKGKQESVDMILKSLNSSAFILEQNSIDIQKEVGEKMKEIEISEKRIDCYDGCQIGGN